MRALFLALVVTACASPAPDSAALTFDPCAPTSVAAPNASAAELASVDEAIAMWRSRGVVGLVRGEPSAIRVEFRDAAAAIYGFYDDATATVLVNIRLDDDTQRAITIAHELGHALGLAHVIDDESVMQAGNLTIAPTERDRVALAQLWGSCEPVAVAR